MAYEKLFLSVHLKSSGMHFPVNVFSFDLQENQFHLYALYNKNKPKSDALMAEYGKEFFRASVLVFID